MKRSTIIATCLVNSNMAKSLDEGEAIVRSVFAEFSPYTDFAKWNENVRDSAARVSTPQRRSRLIGSLKTYQRDINSELTGRSQLEPH